VFVLLATARAAPVPPPKKRRFLLGSLDFAAMLVGMVFSRLGRVMGSMKSVPVSNMSVMGGLLVIPGVMVLGSFHMMSRCVFVVFRRHFVVLGTFVF
jgi:hypothetical protein